jgi:molecular chaperone HscB
MDPFTTLGIEPRFDLDMGDVEKRYRELSRALHPDRYVGRPAGERRLALSKAIEVNEAWRVVRDPVTRAEALLRRGGVEIDESSAPTTRPEFLMEMMELREELAEARAERNTTALAALTRGVQDREARLLAQLTECFDAASKDHDLLDRCVTPLAQLRFVRRFLDEAAAAEDDLT